MRLLPAPYNGGTRIVVLSNMQYEAEGQPESTFRVMY